MEEENYAFDEFQEHAIRTWREDAADRSVIHALMGLTTEIGELTDSFKKHLYYGSELDVQNVVEEMGDVLYYAAVLMYAMGVPLSTPAKECIGKLMIRYPEGFSETAAKARADKQEGNDE